MTKAVIFLSHLNVINKVLIYSYVYIGILTCALAQSSYGTDFYIGIMRNHLKQTEHVWLYIMTTSSSPVSTGCGVCFPTVAKCCKCVVI